MKDHHAHDHGLAHDLATMAKLTRRRQALRLLAGVGLIPLIGCGSSNATSTTSSGAAGGGAGGTGAGGTGSCSDIPEETAGPYPGDGSNGANALTTIGIVRSDITKSFGAISGTAAGIPLRIELTLVDVASGCAPLAGYAIYLWHCDRDGKYSLYTIANQNYLRGVQETDASGKVTFMSIFPACYPGRWPHIHFEMFPSLSAATDSNSKVATSQLALPADVCAEAYTTAGYEASVSTLKQVSLTTDMVFADGSSKQVASVAGNATSGYVASLVVGIST